jgi:hypothetical protein
VVALVWLVLLNEERLSQLKTLQLAHTELSMSLQLGVFEDRRVFKQWAKYEHNLRVSSSTSCKHVLEDNSHNDWVGPLSRCKPDEWMHYARALFCCSYCHKRFATEKLLKEHLQKCEQCERVRPQVAQSPSTPGDRPAADPPHEWYALGDRHVATSEPPALCLLASDEAVGYGHSMYW